MTSVVVTLLSYQRQDQHRHGPTSSTSRASQKVTGMLLQLQSFVLVYIWLHFRLKVPNIKLGHIKECVTQCQTLDRNANADFSAMKKGIETLDFKTLGRFL